MTKEELVTVITDIDMEIDRIEELRELLPEQQQGELKEAVRCLYVAREELDAIRREMGDGRD